VITRVVLLAALLFAGCAAESTESTESGVDGDKRVAQLDSDELHQFCEWVVDIKNATDTSVCDFEDGPPREPRTVEGCLEELAMLAPSCPGTVEQAEACLNALKISPCDPVPQCRPFEDC
jgi:hypothetical protein